MSLHKEISFEIEVCDWLAAHGWLYESGDAERYDRARALFRPTSSHGCRRPSPRRGRRWRRTTARPRRTSCSTACASSSTTAARSTCCGMASRCSGLKQQLSLAQFQPGAGHERRHPRPLRRQPPARRAAGALFDGERELHRPRALPERPAGRDRRTQDGLHAERSGRDRPVSLRSAAPAQGPEPGAAAELSQAAHSCISPSATAKST